MTRRAWVAFAAVSVLWGIPYLFIKLAVDDGVSPLFLAWARVTLAAIVLLAIAARSGTLGTLRGHGLALLAYAVLEICIPFPLIGEGERHVSSSLAAILIAAVPLFVALLALRFDRSERVTGRRLVGLLVGLVGVVALVGIDISGDGKALLGTGAVLLAAVGYAAGPLVLNARLAGADIRALMAGALTISAIVLAPFAILAWPTSGPTARATESIVVLGVFCTAAAFVFYGVLVREVGPSRASLITYVAPVVALALGIVALGETPGPGSVVGLVLILGGSWLATRASREPAPVAVGRPYG